MSTARFSASAIAGGDGEGATESLAVLETFLSTTLLVSFPPFLACGPFRTGASMHLSHGASGLPAAAGGAHLRKEVFQVLCSQLEQGGNVDLFFDKVVRIVHQVKAV